MLKSLFSAFVAGCVLTGAMAFAQDDMLLTAAATQDVATIENELIQAQVSKAGTCLASLVLKDKLNGRTYRLDPSMFSLFVDENKEEKTPAMTLEGNRLICTSLSVAEIAADPKALRLVDQKRGQLITAQFSTDNSGYGFVWSLELREGSPYVRIYVDITPCQDAMPLRKLCLLKLAAKEARVEGTVQGAPVVAAGNRLFAGVESPLGLSKADADGFSCYLTRTTDLPVRVTSRFSAVLGFSEAGQLRRTFQVDYLNSERARPYAPYLNYNTWYDIGYFTRYDEKQAMDTIKLIGEELVKKRGVVMDSFMMDDGWDDVETMWQFHKGLPHEFSKIKKVANAYGAGLGVWFSPWGGYGPPKDNRIAAAKGAYETNEKGFALSGPKYFKAFHDMCLHMIDNNGITHFKLDGTSADMPAAKGSRFGSDFEAIIALIDELRVDCPETYINLTTGTWASPFWFGIADSIWRGNYDHEFCAEGSSRNQWMSYRDSMIYRNNVAISPLFPISSLMTHGVIFNKGARGLKTTEGDDFSNEVWSGFGLGTQMQEIYITPSMLSKEQWDELAAAAKWARSHGDIMVDSHWVGGDPIKLEVYGWASWSPKKAIVTLRNPAAHEQSFTVDPAALFELPVGAPTEYSITSPKGDKLPTQTIKAGKRVTFTLKPYQVIVIDAVPVAKS
ncbi:MAG: enterotoxin [Akkermansia sp.]